MWVHYWMGAKGMLAPPLKLLGACPQSLPAPLPAPLPLFLRLCIIALKEEIALYVG